MKEFSDTDDYGNSRKVLSQHYNELSEAFNNSKGKETLESEFNIVMNQFTVQARGSTTLSSLLVGQRVSMLPASSIEKEKLTESNIEYFISVIVEIPVDG
jgi:hypothetical protein